MRRVLTVLAIVATFGVTSLATAGGGSVVASASGSSRLVLHNAFGVGTIDVRAYTFDARLHADGSADGRWLYSDLEDGVPFDASGTVTCLTVRGNHAWVGGVIERSNDPSYVGLDMWFQVIDNSEGENPPPNVTTLIGAGPSGAAQSYCSRAPNPRFPWNVDDGELKVRDFRH